MSEPQVVLAAVSALTRTPLSAMRRRGPARALFLRAAIELCPRVPHPAIAAMVGVHRNTVLEASRFDDPNVQVVARVLGDPRFAPLHDRRLSWPGRGYRD